MTQDDQFPVWPEQVGPNMRQPRKIHDVYTGDVIGWENIVPG
ncbi:MAG: hypothetical protein NXI32_03305 [bacterium]|nr:hypothetical protein [bacterium]